MKCTLSTVLSLLILTIYTTKAASNGPLVYSSWPPKPKARPQIMVQIRSGTPMYPPRMFYKRPPMAQRLVRPVHVPQHVPQPMPHFLMKPAALSYHQKPIAVSASASAPTKNKFISSAAAPHTGEYVFENPFTTSFTAKPLTSTTNIIRVTSDKRYSPIHTIPAPNLSLQNVPQLTGPKYITEQHDNHIYENKPPVHGQVAVRPPAPIQPIQSIQPIHQYQVTEPTNDHTITDPITGRQKLYAPDPDPSLPVTKVKLATDPFSQPSQPITRPIQTGGFIGTHESPIASALVQDPQNYVQFSGSITPDTYGLSLNGQHQLQQHLMQQQTLLQGMPLSVYNPTYLVTQSNQLYDQHNKQRLFKPEAGFLDSQTNLLGAASENHGIKSVASAGQIYSATQDAIQDIQNELALQSVSGIQQPKINTENTAPIQPNLTQEEVANLLNFGRIDGTEQNLDAYNYYHTDSVQDNDFDITEHQRQNQAILNQAQHELQQQLIAQTTVQVPTSHHQLDQHGISNDETAFSTALPDFDPSAFRIYVSDNDYSNENVDQVYKRSDDDPSENIEDSVKNNFQNKRESTGTLTTNIVTDFGKKNSVKETSTQKTMS